MYRVDKRPHEELEALNGFVPKSDNGAKQYWEELKEDPYRDGKMHNSIRDAVSYIGLRVRDTRAFVYTIDADGKEPSRKGINSKEYVTQFEYKNIMGWNWIKWGEKTEFVPNTSYEPSKKVESTGKDTRRARPFRSGH
ncbi:hypothetical protein MCOR25_007403 [Pyricularia grisea]|nr:hypothetical protein MCOR25_007403 [Pyricularia grisea]